MNAARVQQIALNSSNINIASRVSAALPEILRNKLRAKVSASHICSIGKLMKLAFLITLSMSVHEVLAILRLRNANSM
jgi:hypothetical protein